MLRQKFVSIEYTFLVRFMTRLTLTDGLTRIIPKVHQIDLLLFVLACLHTPNTGIVESWTLNDWRPKFAVPAYLPSSPNSPLSVHLLLGVSLELYLCGAAMPIAYESVPLSLVIAPSNLSIMWLGLVPLEILIKEGGTARIQGIFRHPPVSSTSIAKLSPDAGRENPPVGKEVEMSMTNLNGIHVP